MSQYLDKAGLTYFWGKLKTLLAGKANGNSTGTALKTEGIPFGEVDSTSTATAFTATVSGITELKDGTVVMLRNGVITSASGFTININGLGAKPCYSNMATGNDVTPTNPTRDTTIFNINYTMLFVYQSDLVDGGAWICYRGYDANTNTIGYQLRTNSGSLAASDTGYRYRLWLTSADGTMFVPINTSTSTNATTARTLNTRKIDPFGAIVYNGTNGTVNAGARPAVSTLWQQYTLTIGYSYVLSMTAWKPVYLKCTPQTDGSAVMDTLTQTLPSTNDGYIYIFLGIAYSATAMELNMHHPVYYHDGTGIRLWSGAASGSSSVAWNDITGKPTFATVATSGDYDDLSNKPDFVKSINGLDGVVDIQKNGSSISATGTSSGGTINITVPVNTSDLTNDSGFITASGAPVQSVNGQTGAVSLTIPTVPTNVSAFTNDAGYVNATQAANAAPVQSVSVTQVQTSGTEIAQVSVNGTSTSLYAPSGGGGEALTDSEIEAAVEDAFVVLGHTITISLTNPVNPSSFRSGTVYELYSNEMSDTGELLGTLTSPTDSIDVVVPENIYGIQIVLDGSYPAYLNSQISCSGGISRVQSWTGFANFAVAGDGSVVINGFDYNDD